MRRSYTHWYVGKVHYQTVGKIKQFLESHGAECYVAMREAKQVLPGIVFIHADYEQALSLSEAAGGKITYLRDSATGKFQIIPDKEMSAFRFLQEFSDRTIVLPNPENLRGGEKVRIVKGEFAGIEGELYRIKGHKRVVVRLGNLVSVATTDVPGKYLEQI